MDSTPRRRARTTGPSRAGTGARAGRGVRSGRGGRPGDTRPVDDRAATEDESVPPTVGDSHDDQVGVDPVIVQSGSVDPVAADSGSSRPATSRRSRGGSSRPAGSRPGTAPAATRSGRRIGRITARGRSLPTVTRAKSQLARQIAVLGLVLCAVAFALAVPLRNYLSQSTALSAAINQEQQLRAQLAAIDQQKAALADPAYIASEAKRRLQFVKPGDTVYVVHVPAAPPPPTATEPVRTVAPAPWYSQMWETLSAPAAKGSPGATGSERTTAPSSATPDPGR